MSNYRDPYGTNQYGGNAHDFNPYSNSQQQYPTYEQGAFSGGYDNTNVEANQYTPNEKPPTHQRQESAGGRFDEFMTVPKEKSADSVKKLRAEENSQMWTQGSRGKCIGRFCCCSLFSFLFLLISIVLALALWINPPNVEIGDVRVKSTGGSQFQINNDGLKIDLELPIVVDNPNYFQVAFASIKADLTYPINSTPIGGGESKDVVFKANTNDQNWTFPFAIEYKQSTDPGSRILNDIATKCAAKDNLVVDYKITLGLKILFVTIHPTISNTVRFACPIDSADLAGLLKGVV